MAYGKDDPEYEKKTSIEGRGEDFKGKLVSQQVKELQGKSFAQEIEQDKKMSAVLIGRGEKASGVSNDKNAKQDEESVAIYKRALILLGSCGLKVNSENNGSKDASENNLPVSSYLSHGSRTLIELPKLGKDEKEPNHHLINWLTSGDKDKDGKSKSQDPNEAINEVPPKYVYNRSAATHDVSVDKEGNVKEEKGFTIGLKSFLGNKVLGQETKHFGVDLAVDSEFRGKDSSGKIVLKPDGDHGHLYIHYSPPTHEKPGSIIFGMEGAAPYSSKHSKTGASDPISPTGVSKFDELDIKKQCSGEPYYKESIVPKKYNGLYAKLDTDKINAITNISDKKFSIELAEVKPGTSPENFLEKIKDPKEFHVSPKLLPSKPPEAIKQEKPTLLQNIANKVTLGTAYKKEVNEYKKESKIFKTKDQVFSKDDLRGFEKPKAQEVPKIEALKPKSFFAKQVEKVTTYVKDTMQAVKDTIQTIKEAPAKLAREAKKQIMDLIPDFLKKDKVTTITNARLEQTTAKAMPPGRPLNPAPGRPLQSKINVDGMIQALNNPKKPPPVPERTPEQLKKQQEFHAKKMESKKRGPGV